MCKTFRFGVHVLSCPVLCVSVYVCVYTSGVWRRTQPLCPCSSGAWTQRRHLVLWTCSTQQCLTSTDGRRESEWMLNNNSCMFNIQDTSFIVLILAHFFKKMIDLIQIKWIQIAVNIVDLKTLLSLPFKREQALPTIQIQLQREIPEYCAQADLPPGTTSKTSSGLPKTISKLTSKFTKKVSSSSNSGGSYSIPSTPSRSMLTSSSSEDKAKSLGHSDGRLHSILQMGSLSCTPDSTQQSQLANGSVCEDQGMNLPTD